MSTLKERYIDYTATERDGRLPALDGARALFVLFVAAFHIWQQSWLTPAFAVGGRYITLDPLLRSGYMWVDAMLMLSGFLLYLPYAASAEDGKPAPRILPFYKKRVLRIVPSYYLCVLIMLVFVALPQKSYDVNGALSWWRMGRDLLAHGTFTHTLFQFSYTGSPLNGSLWTLGVEMQFYLIFPFLGRLFRRWPTQVYLCMLAAALCYREWVRVQPDSTLIFNQLPGQLEAYANGMLAAGVYTALKRRMKQDRWTRLLFTAVLCIAVCGIWQLVKGQAACNGYDKIRMGQMDRRFAMSGLCAICLLGLLYGARPLRLIFGNRFTAFLSAVSFQFYMWHQVFAVQLKEWHIPASETETPWIMGEYNWQLLYTALCFAGALAISTLVTYVFERPIARLGNRKQAGRAAKKHK